MGETLLVLLSEIADTLPQAMRIIHQGVELTVIDYEIWKEKVQEATDDFVLRQRYQTRRRIMNKSAIDNISHEEFERAIQEHITWASEWDGALPADVFFGLWADLHSEKRTLELKAHLIEGRLAITAPPEGPVKVVDNHIYLEDGLELILNLE